MKLVSKPTKGSLEFDLRTDPHLVGNYGDEIFFINKFKIQWLKQTNNHKKIYGENILRKYI